jgi:putative hydrolase of the HAD superfamily
MSGIRAIFFDAVGTLIHPEPSAAVAYADAARRFGSRYSLADIRRRFGHAFAKQEVVDRANGWTTGAARELERWRHIVGDVLDDVADREGCFQFLYQHFARAAAWRCEPGIEAAFGELTARGCQLGLASNFDARLYALIEELEPLRIFRAGDGQPAANVVVSFDIGVRKPAAGFFQSLCRRAGFEPGQILHVGDDPANDYAGAEEAGMSAVLFDPRGRHRTWRGRRIQKLGELTFPHSAPTGRNDKA